MQRAVGLCTLHHAVQKLEDFRLFVRPSDNMCGLHAGLGRGLCCVVGSEPCMQQSSAHLQLRGWYPAADEGSCAAARQAASAAEGAIVVSVKGRPACPLAVALTFLL